MINEIVETSYLTRYLIIDGMACIGIEDSSTICRTIIKESIAEKDIEVNSLVGLEVDDE